VLLAFAACTAAWAERVLAVNVDGVVHPITVEVIGKAAAQASREGAEILLIRLNTPGGLAEATREIIEKIVAAPVPVVTYVAPSGGRAASAGFFILEAADVAAMAPVTATGAATPVLFTGGQMDPVMKSKVQNDAAASIRALATKRGRNAALAEKTVYEAKSFTDKEALDDKLIEIIAANDADLFRQLNGREIVRFDGRRQTLHLAAPQVTEYQWTLRERVMAALSDPNLALVMLVIGAIGIYVEFTTPGVVVPGVAGAILVVLGLSALSFLPINWGAAALLVIALALFVLEAKFATHGVLTAGGAVAMVLGAVLLVDSPLPEMRIHLGTALAVTVPFALVTSFLVSIAVRARLSKVQTGAKGMIDEIGTAYTALEPRGKVFIHGEYWSAVSSVPVSAGAQVRVLQVEGLTLRVEPASPQSGG